MCSLFHWNVWIVPLATEFRERNKLDVTVEQPGGVELNQRSESGIDPFQSFINFYDYDKCDYLHDKISTCFIDLWKCTAELAWAVSMWARIIFMFGCCLFFEQISPAVSLMHAVDSFGVQLVKLLNVSSNVSSLTIATPNLGRLTK